MKATDLPEYRGRMIDYWSLARSQEFYLEMAAQVGFFGKLPSREAAEICYDLEVRRWQMADLYFVTAEMTHLAVEAAKTMPTFSLDRSDLPSEFGVMYFDQPIGTSGDEEIGRGEIPIVAAAWGHVPAGRYFAVPGVWVSFYSDTSVGNRIEAAQIERMRLKPEQARTLQAIRAERGPFMYDDEVAFYYGSGDVDLNPDSNTLEGWGRTIRCAWLLMQQAVATVSMDRPDRASRRRIERAGHEVKPVRIVTLRHTSTTAPGSADREYHHRWLVKGHWRKQWYPTQERHVPIWINPHVKGPEGAPLLGGEKVYAWRR